MSWISDDTKKNFRKFTQSGRPYKSFLILSVLFTLSFFAEFLANDKPLLLSFKAKLYLPIIYDYSEKDLGLELPIHVNYKDPAIQSHIKQQGWIIWPPIPYSYKSIDYQLDHTAPAPPSFRHLLGTDDQGRDLIARLLYGFRISMFFGLALTFFSSVVGIVAGGVQGYFGGAVDLFFQRFIEIWSSLPSLFIMIILASIITPNFWWLLGVMILFGWTALVGIVRAEFLKTRAASYVLAAKALGAPHLRIILRHILPNAMVASFTMLPFILSSSVAALTTLDFLGFGLPPGEPSLGELLSQGKENLFAPWIGITAFVFLSTLLTLLIFIGEGIRNSFDPKGEKNSILCYNEKS